jgi:hypothetical protein
MNLIGYIEKYGDLSFKEKEINNIDYLVFGLLSYLDFDGIVSNNCKDKITIGYACHLYFSKYNESYFRKQGLGIRSSIKLMKKIQYTERYCNLEIYNYKYVGSRDIQFSALTIDVNDDLKVISYEGTDDLVSGWKEDFRMSYEFPVEAQKLAIKYANNTISIFDKSNYVFCGHSKGGNLSLVAGMYLNPLKKRHLKHIYSFDGPGIMFKMLNSRKYKSIFNRYDHIVPNSSVFGLLFYDLKYTVVKSNQVGVLSHDAYTWMIKDDDFLYTTMKTGSRAFYKSFNDWVSKYNIKERKYFTEQIFMVFEKCHILSISSFKERKMEYILDVIGEIKNIDDESKRMMIEFIKMMLTESKNMLIDKVIGKE